MPDISKPNRKRKEEGGWEGVVAKSWNEVRQMEQAIDTGRKQNFNIEKKR